MMHVDGFFAYARERYRIHLRRTGQLTSRESWTEAMQKSGKWTCDHILQQYRFCNVFREDDTTTRWIREKITLEGYGEKLFQAMVIARWFNRVETLERLLPPMTTHPPYWVHNLFYTWDSDVARERLKDVKPLVTGAFMVKTPTGMNKLEGLIWCIEHIVGKRFVGNCPVSLESKQAELLNYKHGATLKATTEWLTQFPFLGPFMAYEVVTDLRHTDVLRNASDIMTWANPGPGAARGFGRVSVGDKNAFNRHNQSDISNLILGMRALLKESQDPRHWPSEWPEWEMREVEHTLCEFDKYTRARLGEGRPKHKFKGLQHHSRLRI